MPSRYGRSTIAKTFLICALLAAGGLLSSGVVKILLLAAASGFFLFTLYFFRDPSRIAPAEPNAILAPADGRVLLIKKVSHPFTGTDSTLVSIFMSLFNVHVNRIPFSGRIEHLCYHKGKFLMAFDHDSMNNNERMEIGLQNSGFPVFFTQVAGFVARRIVCNLTIGEHVEAGNRFGMIKFGSRLDIILPDNARIVVSEGEKTLAGKTVIAMRNT
ncbi:phosphatidylserine decarboxylase family protein [Prosthecochloris marina]|uniref:Phosphatidylserine decarboxylase proenzyme n=1 Tax=Prosthecochloris marina TaxID=2017681 RepID=A0A317T4Z9_9CHLB|nr:phosphatidylserine decarboxylase [Prosthecochloris marina]PWW81605.1 phosphatidylserine decarboxylase family protein [Prosthecochloris marina]